MAHFNGTGGNDDFSGTSGDDVFNMTQGGNDTVHAGDGADRIHGGDGNDNFSGEAGDDTLAGGSGDDYLNGGDGANVLYGGSGDDVLIDAGAGSLLSGGRGDDVIEVTGDTGWTAMGGIGDDQVVDQGGRAAVLDGGRGADNLHLDRSAVSGDTTIVFRPGSGAVETLPDGTTFRNFEHLDLLTGAGNDSVVFNEPIWGHARWTLDNSWDAGGGFDAVTVLLSDNTAGINAFFGAVYYQIQQIIAGVWQNTLLVANVEAFNLTAGSGDDVLVGGPNADILIGNGGDDEITGGEGADTIVVGLGSDTVVYSGAADSMTGSIDTLEGFNAAADKIDLWFAVSAIDAPLSGDLANLENIADAAHLGVDAVLLFSATDGHVYLVMDADGTAGYQDGEDMLVRLDDAKHLSALSTGDFI